MNFSSITFVYYFLPLVVLLYFSFKGRTAHNLILLCASLLFYAWGEGYLVVLLLGSIGFNHWIARGIDTQRQAGEKSGIFWLAGGVATNLVFLIVFKYLGLLSELLEPLGVPRLNVHLPLGISFFTFQAISMIVDVYRGTKPAKSILRTGLFIAMFPQLIAGPIVRFNEIRAQIEDRNENFDRFAEGVKFFVIGLAQKVLIADILSAPADTAFGQDPAALGVALAWFGLICFSLQIYYDFAGYSNMAIGLGRFFGFKLPQNFAHPYSASNFREFWRRWHMTLSRWFRDYLYIPLGGSRLSSVKTYRNLLIVFVLVGVWHGAAWTFAFWGLWHGFFLIMERLCPRLPVSGKIAKPLGMVYVGVFVSLGWVLFRADDMQHALGYWLALSGANGSATAELLAVEPLVFLVFAIGFLLAWDGWGDKWTRIVGKVTPRFEAIVLPLALWGSVAGLYLLSFIVMASDTHKPFLYFRF